MLRRQCTGDYKIEPIYRFCKTLIGRRRGQRHTTPLFCEMWIGISAEENARRCKPSQEAWVTNRYPLRELGLNRADCEAWLLKHYKIVVSKSACLGCLMWNIGPETTTPVGRDRPTPISRGL